MLDGDLPSVTEQTDYYVFQHTIQQTLIDRGGHRRELVVQLAFPQKAALGKTDISEFGLWRPCKGFIVYDHRPQEPEVQFRVKLQSPALTTHHDDANFNVCDVDATILDGIAQTFARAITQFATKDHPLRHSWLNFIPAPHYLELAPWPKILDELKERPILETRKTGILKRPCELRLLPGHYLHDNAPIFEDLPNEQYLASEYTFRHQRLLERLGVITLTSDELLDRLEADWRRSESKIRSLSPKDDWHKSCAKLLLQILPSEGNPWRRLKSFAIIPIGSSSSALPKWVKPPSKSLNNPPSMWLNNTTTTDRKIPRSEGLIGNFQEAMYFPLANGVPIPHFRTLCLVEEHAASIPERAALFSALGIQNCSMEVVLDTIKRVHEETRQGGFVVRTRLLSNTEDDFIDHFKYLFHSGVNPELLKPWICVPTETGLVRKPSQCLYFPSEQEYDTQKLLGISLVKTKLRPIFTSNEDAWTSTSKLDNRVAFVSKTLLHSISSDTRCYNLSWLDWLTEATGARYFPPLMDHKSSLELSPLFLAAVDQRPEIVVKLLRAHWKSEYESKISSTPWVCSKIRNLRVLCEFETTNALQDTFLPSGELKTLVMEFNVEDHFPFIKLPVAVDSTNYKDWQFLESLGVGVTADMRFYKLILERIRSHKIASTRA